MFILIVRQDTVTPLEGGSRYFVKDAREAALLVYGIKNSSPSPEKVSYKFFEVNLETKTITELNIPKVVFAID